MFQWEYAETDTLDGNPELGLKFIVHAPYEVPVINSMGYAAGPGSKAYVGFEKTAVSSTQASTFSIHNCQITFPL